MRLHLNPFSCFSSGRVLAPRAGPASLPGLYHSHYHNPVPAFGVSRCFTEQRLIDIQLRRVLTAHAERIEPVGTRAKVHPGTPSIPVVHQCRRVRVGSWRYVCHRNPLVMPINVLQ